MDANEILDADVLDIVFEGRNKEYGAYELRRTYNRRLAKAIAIMSSVLLLGFVGCSIVGRTQGEKVKLVVDGDVDLAAVKDPVVETVPPAPKPIEQKVKTIQFVVPKVVKDVDAKDVPPEQDKLDDVKIGTVNVDGAKDDRTVGPPAPVGEGHANVIEAPKQEDEGIVLHVQIESTFPGGMQAWARFLNKNLRYSEEAQALEVQGQVIVQFVVDKDGNVSDVEAVSGPEKGGLREEAVRVIKKSGKWVPGNQNGRPVKSYKRQPVTFQLEQ